jgi:hypothetical protein
VFFNSLSPPIQNLTNVLETLSLDFQPVYIYAIIMKAYKMKLALIDVLQMWLPLIDVLQM